VLTTCEAEARCERECWRLRWAVMDNGVVAPRSPSDIARVGREELGRRMGTGARGAFTPTLLV
jgi:hypothetical protein